MRAARIIITGDGKRQSFINHFLAAHGQIQKNAAHGSAVAWFVIFSTN